MTFIIFRQNTKEKEKTLSKLWKIEGKVYGRNRSKSFKSEGNKN
jgi:hypothetical protein